MVYPAKAKFILARIGPSEINTVYCVNSVTASSLFLKASENKIKVKITMVDFQQQSTQRLVNK